jgi:tetratricopeptide (TPR) repeat protein
MRKALLLHPESGLRYANLLQNYLRLNRLGDGKSIAREALSKNLDSPFLRLYMYQIAFLENEVSGMAQQVVWAADKPGVEDILLGAEAETVGYTGRQEKSREFTREAAGIAGSLGENETAAGYEANAALREALFGNAVEAHHHTEAALKLASTSRDVMFAAALALAISGESDRSLSLATQLAQIQDTIVKFLYLPTIAGQLALRRREPAKAVEELQSSGTFELGQAGDATLMPAYSNRRTVADRGLVAPPHNGHYCLHRFPRRVHGLPPDRGFPIATVALVPSLLFDFATAFCPSSSLFSLAGIRIRFGPVTNGLRNSPTGSKGR